MGQVHVARHASGRRVVVKRLRDTLVPDQRFAARFGDEGRVSRRVSHPNVVRVFEHGVSADGTPFIVMEHARGTTLRRLVLDEGPLPLARIRKLIAQLLGGLAAIHDAGIVHADIKSGNLIVDADGGADHLTIIDFGLARTRTSQDAGDGVIAGTPEYMAPEVLRGEPPTVRADVYAAAIVAYELIVGITPFGGDAPPDVLQRQLSEPIELPADARGFAAAFEEAIAEIPARGTGEPAPGAGAPGASAAGEPAPAPAPEPELEPETEAVLHRRQELFEALETGRPEPIVVAYLALADTLICDDRLLAAVQELEGALVLLLPSEGEPPESVWRIELLLAAMHDRIGNAIRARRVAIDAHEHAARYGSKSAARRAGALMRRLMMPR